MSQLFQHEKRLYYPLEDKVVLITGAANGIGAATSIILAKSGYKKLALVMFIICSKIVHKASGGFE